ncbi:MAG: deoxyribodipyrimidine photolyase [Myxococcota bacterium]
MTVPNSRVRLVNQNAPNPSGHYVLYWMIATRRPNHNYALDRALELCAEFGKPLLVLEALRVGYLHASQRLHRFVIAGMADNAAAFRAMGVHYYPYIEPEAEAGRGLLRALSAQACAVVTDEFPCFFLPKMVARAGELLEKRLIAVDSNGLLPIRMTDRVFTRAFSFRRFMQQTIGSALSELPSAEPAQVPSLQKRVTLPKEIEHRYPPASTELLALDETALAKLPIDASVTPTATRGGWVAAKARLDEFVGQSLPLYGGSRNHPDSDTSSRLSPYLHFGHISPHQVFSAVMASEEWEPGQRSSKVTGSRAGFWGVGESAESFLDELITWRELGLNFCAHRGDYDQVSALPDWAQTTLDEHRSDPRDTLYSLEELELAKTHDPIWNAAQRELVREGRIHNYLRMLWGKLIYAWSPSPEQAAERMVYLNDRYALDGRDPNSYSGIFWVLGRYDRAWGPERPVFGKIRYMTSDSTRRKLRLSEYLATYGAPSAMASQTSLF